MNPDEIRSVLREIPLFSELDDDELREISALARPQTFAAGRTIFHQGDHADGMHVLESGRIRISARLLGEGEVELATLGPGDVLGEFSLVDRGIRSATACAIEPSRGLFFSNRHFDVLRSDLRPAAFKTMRRISRELWDRLRSLDQAIDTKSNAPMARPLPSWVHESTTPVGERFPINKLDRRILRVLPFFGTLVPSELEDLLSLPMAWKVPKGRILFRQGSSGDSSFLIVRGAVQVSLEKGAGFENLSVLGPGRIFGLSLMGHSLRTATCYAREQAILLEIESKHFERLFDGSSSIAFKFFEALNEMLIAQLRSGNRQLGRMAAQGVPAAHA